MSDRPVTPPEDERIVAEDPDFPPRHAERGPVDLSGFMLHMAGHAHIDLGYRWNQAETVHYVAPWTFRGVLELMDRTPGFTFSQSQMYLYEAMRREYPAIFQRILAAVRRGAWEVVGGAWCEYDAILPSGESVIRQHLLGVRYAAEVLGVEDHPVAFVPDSFCGHAATLPQILAGCGFQYYIFGRGLPQDPAAPDRTRRAFRWRGPDGTGVVAYLPFGPYATPPMTPAYLGNYLPYARTSVSPHELVLYGQGDHGGGPRQADIEALQALKTLPQGPRWQYSSVAAQCRSAFTAAVANSLEEYRGNLGGFATGALTSQAQIKRRNRILERQLLAAEATAVVGAVLSRKPAFPRVEAGQLWRGLLTEQFHDILPGTSVASVYRDTHRAYDAVESGARELLNDGFRRICSRLDTRGDGVAVILYNPGLTAVRMPVTIPVPAWVRQPDPDSANLLDSAGRPVACQLNDRGLTLIANLPSLGYQSFRLHADASQNGAGRAAFPAAPVWQAPVLQSDRVRLTFDTRSGDLVEWLDRRNDRQVLSGASNTLELYTEMSIATSWVLALTGDPQPLELLEAPHVTESTPFYTRVSTTSRSPASTFTREVTLHADVDRLDFRLQVRWNEGNACLKLGFAPALRSPAVRAALAHGCVTVQDPGREFCMHEFVDLKDGSHGLTLFNDGAYGAQVVDGRLGVSVIRTVRDMDPGMAHGNHELRYSLLPHAAALPDHELWQQAGALTAQPLCCFEPEHPGGIKTWGSFDNSQALPPASSLVQILEPGALLCAFKMPAEEWLPLSYVVRLRELNGTGGHFTVYLPTPVANAMETDHLERPRHIPVACEGRQLRLPLQPWQIKTVVARVD